jgi:hypothetical protein
VPGVGKYSREAASKIGEAYPFESLTEGLWDNQKICRGYATFDRIGRTA